jgi:hypothetical protein
MDETRQHARCLPRLWLQALDGQDALQRGGRKPAGRITHLEQEKGRDGTRAQPAPFH